MIRTKQKILSWLLSAAIALSLMPVQALAADTGEALQVNLPAVQSDSVLRNDDAKSVNPSDFAGGTGTADDPYQISTVQQLTKVSGDLGACYVLNNDLDLTDVNGWTPIGAFVAGEDSETPAADAAFHGTFDGGGNTITGLQIEQENGMCLGLFGCVANGTIKDLTIKGASISGYTMAAAAVGYACNSTLDNVDVTGTNTIKGTLYDGNFEAMGSPAPNMVAGVVGAGMDSTLVNCDASGVTVTMESYDEASGLAYNVHDAGILGGGLEGSTLENCTAADSSITADGPYIFGIGGLSGCAMEADFVKSCSTENVTITLGRSAYLVGGLLGYTGQSTGGTEVTGCSAKNTTINVGANSTRVGGLLGGGFYIPAYASYYPVPTGFVLSDCSSSGTISAGEGSTTGTLVGYTYEYSLPDSNTSQMAGQLVGEAAAAFENGSGTAESPYQIASGEGLNAVRRHPDAHYKLTADIDLNGYSWTPIGTASVPFTGSIDGLKDDGGTYTISNISVTAAEADGFIIAGGLFNYTAGGNISNLTVKNVSVTVDESDISAEGGSMSTGGVVGYAMSGGTLSNVTVTADDGKRSTISGSNCVGGLIGGDTDAVVTGCSVEKTDIVVLGNNDFSKTPGRIIQRDMAQCGGPLIGGGFGGSVTNCSASDSTVTATGSEPVGLGGLAGCLQCMDTVTGNTVSGVSITSSKGGHAIGGLAGYAGTDTNGAGADSVLPAAADISGNTVSVSINAPGATHVGGLVGTGLYHYGMESRFSLNNNTVSGSIAAGTDADSVYGTTAPGAVAGRAAGSTIGTNTFSGLTINGAAAAAENAVGLTNVMYESSDQYEENDTTGEFLYGLTGTYQQLFEGATFESKYDHYWHDYCAAILGETQATTYAAMLKSSIGGPSTAVGDSSAQQFFCGFYDKDNTGAATFKFDGTQISSYTADNTRVFSHTYRYVGTDGLYRDGQKVMDGFTLFETMDANDDEFKYFYMAPDTPDSTYHIEFRYGSNLEALKQMSTGDYASWLAAGIPTDAAEIDYEKVISLFCLENMDYSGERTKESLSQIKDLTGTWDCKVSDYPALQQAGVTSLYCVLGSDGVGRTYGNGTLTGTYSFYAYDNDETGRSGVYAARADQDAEPSHYSLSSNGRTLSFTTLDNESIAYTKRSSSSGSGSGGGSSSSGSSSNTSNGSSGSSTDTTTATKFTDVAAGAYYKDAVSWAVEKGITSGTTAATFSPDATCTRAQAMTFLWKAAGSPEPTNASNPFTDIASSDYYYKAVLWAVEKGITSGTSAVTFSPNATVTRAQAVTFQYHAAGSPDVTAETQFADVAANAYYADAVLWASSENVTSGTSATTFGPDDACSRAQIVTFLYHQFK